MNVRLLLFMYLLTRVVMCIYGTGLDWDVYMYCISRQELENDKRNVHSYSRTEARILST